VSGIGGDSSLTKPPASRQSLSRSVCVRAVTVHASDRLHRRIHALPTNTSFCRARDGKNSGSFRANRGSPPVPFHISYYSSTPRSTIFLAGGRDMHRYHLHLNMHENTVQLTM
jgi:hypothetical protein